MYSTLDNLKAIIPEEVLLQLTDDDNAGAFIYSPANGAYTRVLAAITDADTLINSYVGGRYPLPFAVTPPEICSISANLAVCNLFARKHEHKLPEGLAARRKDNMEWLKAIQSGEAVIVGVDKSPPAQFEADASPDDVLFTDDLLQKM